MLVLIGICAVREGLDVLEVIFFVGEELYVCFFVFCEL